MSGIDSTINTFLPNTSCNQQVDLTTAKFSHNVILMQLVRGCKSCTCSFEFIAISALEFPWPVNTSNTIIYGQRMRIFDQTMRVKLNVVLPAFRKDNSGNSLKISGSTLATHA